MLNPVDIVDKNNQPTGKTSNPEEVNRKGLWHRGVHVALYTDDGKVMIQKRSKDIIRNPGALDIGVGGYVDAGEEPADAAVREVFEETGIKIDKSKLKLFETEHFNHRWKLEGKLRFDRSITCEYIYNIGSSDCKTMPQACEVEWIRFISLRQAQWLLKRHHSKKLGEIEPRYALYADIIKHIKKEIKDAKKNKKSAKAR